MVSQKAGQHRLLSLKYSLEYNSEAHKIPAGPSRPWLRLRLAVTCALLLGASLQQGFAEDICKVYREGTTTVTVYCPGAQKCIANSDNCSLTAEQKKKFDALGKVIDELKARSARLDAEIKVFNMGARRSGRRDRTTYRPGSGHCPDSYPFHCRCEPAGGGAAWAAMCRPNAPSTATPRYRYREAIITPQRLYHRAAQGCQSAGWEARDRCVVMGKVQILMNEAPTIRSACSGLGGDALIRCVDGEYRLPAEESGAAFLGWLKDKIDALPDTISGVGEQIPPGE